VYTADSRETGLDSIAEAWMAMAEEALISPGQPIISCTLLSFSVLPFAVQYTTGDSDDTQDKCTNIDAVTKYVVGSDSVSKERSRVVFNTYASFVR
jgi:hypothetical protein